MLQLNTDVILKVLRTMTNPANYPVLYGCATGKDRTGLTSCLILGMLGASEEDIIADYVMSQAAVAHNGVLEGRGMDSIVQPRSCGLPSPLGRLRCPHWAAGLGQHSGNKHSGSLS